MANQKISQLTTIVTVDTASDLFPIVDTSAAETKKITPSALKTALALNNVDNTSDANKPISTATQSAINLKVDKNSNIVGATKTKITYDEKGLVISGSDISASDLPTGIDAIKIADGTVTNAEFQFIGGLTSDAQSQISAKQATLVSGTNIKTINGTSVLGSGNISVAPSTAIDATAIANGSVTSTEFQYLDGASSNIQTQIDSKTNKLVVANRQTASYTLVLSDADKLVEMNVGSANNLTVPLNSSVAFSTGTQILLAQYGAGQTTIVATSGVTIRSNGAKLKLNAQYSGATLIKIDTNEWYLFGDIA
jgi:hypothetical protein